MRAVVALSAKIPASLLKLQQSIRVEKLWKAIEVLHSIYSHSMSQYAVSSIRQSVLPSLSNTRR